MKQRLGIAKALVNRPKVIFLDEPTLGLDPSGQRDIQQLIRNINQDDGITVFITSHLLKDIEVLCNTVCIIKDGLLVEQGSIKELQEKYMTAYTILLQTSDNNVALPLIQKIGDISDVSYRWTMNSLLCGFPRDITQMKLVRSSAIWLVLSSQRASTSGNDA
jgi:ABC-2 type transport system ATP-binding protein